MGGGSWRNLKILEKKNSMVQPSNTISQRSILIFKFSFLTFLRCMSCSMSIEQKLCEEDTFQLQYMSNAILCIDKRFVVKNSDISCLALMFNLNNPNMKIQHIQNWFDVAKYDNSYTVFNFLLLNQYEPMC